MTRRLLLAFLICLSPGLAGAQPDVDLSELTSNLAQAITEFQSAEQGQSLVRFTALINRLEDERRQGTLTSAGSELLVRAYEYRARVHFNVGNTEKATENFRDLIVLAPEHNLDEATISPKVISFFKDLKARIIGYLSVQSVPQGASVLLNGRPLSVTDFFPIEVAAGDYTLDISKNGYRPESSPVKVVAGETLSLQFDLVRTSASGFVITEPNEVEVLIDGIPKGMTEGLLDPAMAAIAAARGLDPARSSRRLEIPNLAAGSHTIEFRKPCYVSLKLGLDIPEPQDYDIPPIKLEPSVGTIALTSDPPGGQIFIDGEPQGTAPRTLRSVCAGVRRVEVRHAAGKFVQDVDLKVRGTVTLAAEIRPSLAFLGLVADGPAAERKLAEATVGLLRAAAAEGAIRGLNFVQADRAIVDRTLAQDRLTLKDLLPPSKPEPALLRRVFEKLATALEVQGFLMGRIPEEPLARSASLFVLAAGGVIPDSASVVISDVSSYASFFETLGKRAPSRAPWSGLVTIDTLLHPGPVVLRAAPGSPAEKALFARGQVVTAVGGQNIARTDELLAALSAAGTKQPVAITVLASGGATTVEILLQDAPREITLAGTGAFANKLSMDLRQTIEGYPGSEDAAFARLNLGLIALRLRDYSGAHDAFVKAKNELPTAPGLSRGTAAFYAGAALEHLGYARDALEEYAQAEQDSGATLFSPDGPQVKDIARRRIAALSGVR